MIRRLLEATLIPSNRAFALSEVIRKAGQSLLSTSLVVFRLGETHQTLAEGNKRLRHEVEQHQIAAKLRAHAEARKTPCGHPYDLRRTLPDGAGRHFRGCIQCEYDRRGAALATASWRILGLATLASRAEEGAQGVAEIADALKGRDVE